MSEYKHSLEELRQWQALPLDVKVLMTKERIRNWVREFGVDGVYVSFSGGKDSTVLLEIAREMYPDIRGCFVDTGLEFPEVREFVKTYDNIDWIKPAMNFRKVIETYGYPFISKEVSQRVYEVQKYGESAHAALIRFNPDSDRNKKYKGMYSLARYKYLIGEGAPRLSHMCCHVMKKRPAKKYERETGRKPMTAIMASESKLRETAWLSYGCNAFDIERPRSIPLAFWTEQDVLEYILKHNIKIAACYGEIIPDYKDKRDMEGQLSFADLDGSWRDIVEGQPLTVSEHKRTGCMFCGFGCHLEKKGEGRFEVMKMTHPKQYEYIMKDWEDGGLGFKKVIDWMNENGNFEIGY